MEMVTKAEKEQIEKRLNELLGNRQAVSQRIAEARAMGDLKENGDYHAAREQQGIEEAEIRRLQERLATVSVVDASAKETGIVFLGATVKLREEGSDEEELFRLVGEATSTNSGDIFDVTANS
ncbi:MAG: hypothetical protein Q8L55_10965, partial [Phycisphaerales bacterium]|nr:hypothetical protein [Phycisphaerales bacterium]